jgi:hypothetical protein
MEQRPWRRDAVADDQQSHTLWFTPPTPDGQRPPSPATVWSPRHSRSSPQRASGR